MLKGLKIRNFSQANATLSVISIHSNLLPSFFTRDNRNTVISERKWDSIALGMSSRRDLWKGEHRYTFHGNLPTINACTLRVENMVVFIHNYKSELIVITFLREAFISKLYSVEVARQIWRILFPVDTSRHLVPVFLWEFVIS